MGFNSAFKGLTYTYCCSTTNMVTHTRVNVTFIHRLRDLLTLK